MWKDNSIQENVAEFDIFQNSRLSTFARVHFTFEIIINCLNHNIIFWIFYKTLAFYNLLLNFYVNICNAISPKWLIKMASFHCAELSCHCILVQWFAPGKNLRFLQRSYSRKGHKPGQSSLSWSVSNKQVFSKRDHFFLYFDSSFLITDSRILTSS